MRHASVVAKLRSVLQELADVALAEVGANRHRFVLQLDHLVHEEALVARSGDALGRRHRTHHAKGVQFVREHFLQLVVGGVRVVLHVLLDDSEHRAALAVLFPVEADLAAISTRCLCGLRRS